MVSETMDEMRRRLAGVEAERDELRRELDSRSNADVETWLAALRAQALVDTSFSNTLSWRITRPLRLMRSYQIKVSQLGLVPATRAAVAVARRRLRRARR